MAPLNIIDNRFPEPGIDARFAEPGVDWRFKDFPDDNRFPEPGIDRRWMGGPWGEWTPSALFKNGEQGWLMDLSLASMFQDAAGTIPVTDPGQPVGRVVDKSGRGNHWTQPTALNRPIYGREPKTGRRNLLTWTEDFGNAAWVKSGVNATVNTLTSTGSLARIYQLSTLASGVTHTYSVKLKAGTSTLAAIRAVGFDTQPAAWFDLSNGTVGTVEMGLTAAISAADADGFYRCQIRFSSTTDVSGDFSIYIADVNGSFVTTSGKTMQAKEAQLEVGSEATAYQRVTTAFDVTEEGVPSVNYLSFNGTNQWMQTAAFDWGSDEVTQVVGIDRKAATLSIAIEFSPVAAFNPGSFYLAVPETVEGRLGTAARGTATPGAAGRAMSATAGLPDVSVVSAQHSISGSRSDIWKNGVAGTPGNGDKGTGNFGNYPLFIGMRGGSSTPFTGNMYPSLGINRLLSEDELASAEEWVAERTGGLTL